MIRHAFITNSDVLPEDKFKRMVKVLSQLVRENYELSVMVEAGGDALHVLPLEIKVRKIAYKPYPLDDFSGLGVAIHEMALDFSRKNLDCNLFLFDRGYNLRISPDRFKVNGKNLTQNEVLTRLKDVAGMYWTYYQANKASAVHKVFEEMP